MSVNERYNMLLDILKKTGRLAVAFSGGVDSAFLLYAARQALGDDVTAYTAESVFFPRREGSEASDFCRRHNIRQIVVQYDVLSREGISGNPSDRCYLCKKALFGMLKETAARHGIDTVAEGSNVDDLSDYRPGMKAVEELGILSPLREAGLSKGDIRELSHSFGLETWSKPSFACLASRFAYGEEITAQKLGMVERAEELLMSLGFTQFRVRIHGMMARIEVLPEQIGLLMRDDMRLRVARELHDMGFSYVSADMDGYRMGSMNSGLQTHSHT